MAGGRPSSFTPEIGFCLCEYLMDGMSLRKACKQPNMPSAVAVIRWLAEGDTFIAQGVEHPKAEFRKQYAYAREVQADVLFDECLDISDDNESDSYLDDEGKTIYNLDHIQRMKLRVDTRKWMVGKLKPKVYGDKTDVTTNGKDIKGGIIVVSSEKDKELLESI